MQFSLTQIASASRDEEFIGRVAAATMLAGLPFHPNMVMHVATRVDLSNGPEGVPDSEIMAAVIPENTVPENPPPLPDSPYAQEEKTEETPPPPMPETEQ